jgi:hypothetical protein
MTKLSSSRRRRAAAMAVVALCSTPAALAAASPSSSPAPKTALATPTTKQLDVCSLHYSADAKQHLASMELSYRQGKCVVAARTVGASCAAQAADDAVLLGPFACDAPVPLSTVSARLAGAGGAANRRAPSLAGPGLNAWLTVDTVAANATKCSLTLQEPTKLFKAAAPAAAPQSRHEAGGRAGAAAGARSGFLRAAYTLSGLGCRAAVAPGRASVDAAADALLGGPAEQRRPFTFGLWVAPDEGPLNEGQQEQGQCRLLVSAAAPQAERVQAMARSAVAGDAFLAADKVACRHHVPLADDGALAQGCCYGGR